MNEWQSPSPIQLLGKKTHFSLMWINKYISLEGRRHSGAKCYVGRNIVLPFHIHVLSSHFLVNEGSVQFSRSVMSDSLRPHELQHARPPCPPPTPGAHSNSRPSSRWCHPAVSSSVVPLSSCPQSLPKEGQPLRKHQCQVQSLFSRQLSSLLNVHTHNCLMVLGKGREENASTKEGFVFDMEQVHLRRWQKVRGWSCFKVSHWMRRWYP